jgi:hypothetical protein
MPIAEKIMNKVKRHFTNAGGIMLLIFSFDLITFLPFFAIS